jgi:hypothetical protein
MIVITSDIFYLDHFFIYKRQTKNRNHLTIDIEAERKDDITFFLSLYTSLHSSSEIRGKVERRLF